MWPDGICRTTDKHYTKTVQFQDINYQLCKPDDKDTIFGGWAGFLNYFDSSIDFSLSFLNRSVSSNGLASGIFIAPTGDEFDGVRDEYNGVLEAQLALGNNSIVKTKYLTFGIDARSHKDAENKLKSIEIAVLSNFKKLGVPAAPLSGKARLRLLHSIFHIGTSHPFRFNWKWLVPSGLSTKDFIAPSGFEFKTGNSFRMGDVIGQANFLQIDAAELDDRVLADLLDVESDIRKLAGRISYADNKEFGAFYKDWYKHRPEEIERIREALETTSPDSLDDDLNLAFLYANKASDLPRHCRRLLTGDASQAAKAYAAWLLGKCGTTSDLPLIWVSIRAEKEQESYDFGSDDPMKYRNYMDAVEQLKSCTES